MAAEATGFVAEADLERELAAARDGAASSRAGIFGPSSMVWRVDREAAIFLGAGRALLLQLAHPWIAAAIAEHSRSLADPIGRFHRTFGIVFTMVFGSTAQAVGAARRVYRRHTLVRGVLSEGAGPFAAGSGYRANDLAALRWVFATLAETAIIAFELVNPPLTVAERARYYAEIRRFASLFGIAQTALPQSWPAFLGYVEEMLGSDRLAVTAAARAVADGLFAGAATRLRSPLWYRALTASLLPARLRDGFGLDYGPAERRAANRALTVLRLVYPRIPERLRCVAPYQEARARLAGHEQPGISTRLLNRLWIGRSSISGDPAAVRDEPPQRFSGHDPLRQRVEPPGPVSR